METKHTEQNSTDGPDLMYKFCNYPFRYLNLGEISFDRDPIFMSINEYLGIEKNEIKMVSGFSTSTFGETVKLIINMIYLRRFWL